MILMLVLDLNSQLVTCQMFADNQLNPKTPLVSAAKIFYNQPDFELSGEGWISFRTDTIAVTYHDEETEIFILDPVGWRRNVQMELLKDLTLRRSLDICSKISKIISDGDHSKQTL